MFKAFQSNLLSLLNHELKTPLMGILNALTLLEELAEETGAQGLSTSDLLAMARRNANQLHQSLASLLDIAALESGLFHARLREVNLASLVSKVFEGVRPLNKKSRLNFIRNASAGGLAHKTVLADPQKLKRAIDLCLEVIFSNAEPESKVNIRISNSGVIFQFKFKKSCEGEWDQLWKESLAGFKSGVTSPGSIFSGALQSEQAFLSRAKEGLGNELVLVHELMRLHHGNFEASRKGVAVQLQIKLPELASEEGLIAVLGARTQALAPEQGGLSSIALCLIKVPPKTDLDAFTLAVKKGLFRASDSVYALPNKSQVALILEDCKIEDAPRLLLRLEKRIGMKLQFGVSTCPSDGLDPRELMKWATKRMLLSKR